jgi:TctA family transporter
MQSSQPDNNTDNGVGGHEGNGPGRRNADDAGRRAELYRYAGLSGQVAVSVGISIFFGVKADKWLHLTFPIFSWALPLLVIVLLIIKLVKESSGRNDGK